MKPYTRGNFRVVKRLYFGTYQIEARERDTTNWFPIFVSFDYLSTARLKVRNLHAAARSLWEVADLVPPNSKSDPKV
jgi:hypothetical protein